MSASKQDSQTYNQTLLRYINHIINIINSMNPNEFIHSRFNELFSQSSSLLKLLENNDYMTLLLKGFIFIADLLPNMNIFHASSNYSSLITEEASPKKGIVIL